MRGSVALRAAVAAAAAVGAVAGCSGATQDEEEPDIEAARRFDRHPLYWVGERFEQWDLEHVTIGQEEFLRVRLGLLR
jgi:hypothetical protein